MKTNTLNRKLFSFLDDSPTPFHAIESIKKILKKSGFINLSEKQGWKPIPGQPYYVVRQDGSLIAFNIGSDDMSNGFRIVGAHSDSPCLQIKPQPDIIENSYHKLGVEVYGGALLAPWFDRELSIAGRVCYQTSKKEIKSQLINFDRAVAIIPSLAIHLDRGANKERTINAQNDITPIFALSNETSSTDFSKHLISQIKKEHDDNTLNEILSYDLFCYDSQKAGYTGISNEFIASGRLDNLLSCFVATHAVSSADRKNNFMFICNNHEEIGSTTSSGAQGNLALSVFERLLPDTDKRHVSFANSFFISLDNAHAIHPNFSSKSEPSHDVFLNHGPVLKINANKRYATSSLSNSLFKLLCKEMKVPIQEFVMRNDMACGSTIGPINAAKLGISTVDVGAASLAMHSIRELTGHKDPYLMFKVMQHFFQRNNLPVVNR